MFNEELRYLLATTSNFWIANTLEDVRSLTDEQKDILLEWVTAEFHNHKARDDLFILLCDCQIDPQKIFSLFLQFPVPNPEVIFLIEESCDDWTKHILHDFTRRYGRELVSDPDEEIRDSGKLLLISLAEKEKNAAEWLELAELLTDESFHGIADLRQEVYYDFLARCDSETTLHWYVLKVRTFCLTHIKTKQSVDTQTGYYMFWVLETMNFMGETHELSCTIQFLQDTFADNLPESIQDLIAELSKKRSSETEVRAPCTGECILPTDAIRIEKSLEPHWQVKRVRGNEYLLYDGTRHFLGFTDQKCPHC